MHKKPTCAVLFDGGGLARTGLELAGFDCTGFELDPLKHILSQQVGAGVCVLADVRDVDLSGFDAIWCSPPCQALSSARTQGKPTSAYAENLLPWCLELVQKYPDKIIWIENVIPQGKVPTWGTPYNGAQFLEYPTQNRNRMIGGNYPVPEVYRPYKRFYSSLILCPTVTATEWKGSKNDARRASRYYGRALKVEECAYQMGFDMPASWWTIPSWFTGTPWAWKKNLYETIGNGVIVPMATAFGRAAIKQLEEKAINDLATSH